MGEKILITGGAGFIGCNLANQLQRAGGSVVVVDSLHPQVHPSGELPKEFPEGVCFHPFDVTDGGSWRALLQLTRPTTVVHLAAETGTGQSLTQASRHARVNVLGTAQLTDALSQTGIKPHIVLASSRAIYGDGAWRDTEERLFYPEGRSQQQLEQKQWDHVGPNGLPAQPLAHRAGYTEPRPISVYGATKLTQEHLLAAWCTAFACPLSVLRLQNVYGPGQSLANPYTGVLSLFAQLALRKQPINVFEDGAIGRDFVYIGDVVNALQKAIAQRPASGVQTMDIGSGQKVTILEVAQFLARRCGAPAPRLTGTFRHGDVRSAACSIEAAKACLDYQPAVQVDLGLERLMRWVASQPTSQLGD
jgi:dTDP-L-rhamnose 4-epimerase